MFVPDRILNKRSTLSDEEFQSLKTHPGVAAEILNTVATDERTKKAVECHHEYFDGSGYPSGLRGEEIPLWARIVSVADAYVNLTSDRSMAPGKTSEQALAELERSSGTKYDGMLVRILARELKSERSLPNLIN
jgi:HD-GYP domain-containing protein (c-di-GMP phosphodiesterase class II)